MNGDYFDRAPYSMIGVQTTLPGRTRKAQNPIGFIWPKTSEKVTLPGKARGWNKNGRKK